MRQAPDGLENAILRVFLEILVPFNSQNLQDFKSTLTFFRQYLEGAKTGNLDTEEQLYLDGFFYFLIRTLGDYLT
jgi:hypothetical protein